MNAELKSWSATGGLCVVSNMRNIKHDSTEGGLNDGLTIFFLFVLFMEPLMCRTCLTLQEPRGINHCPAAPSMVYV